MPKINDLNAMDIALKLANINLESTSSWISPESVVEFIDKVYKGLLSIDSSDNS